MNLIATTLSLSLTPLLLSTQAQASQVAVPIASVQSLKPAQPNSRSKVMTAESALRLKAEVSRHLSHLFELREKLERAIRKVQEALDKGEHVDLSAALIQAAESGIEMGEVTITVAKDSFGAILASERVACRLALTVLRDETIKGLSATVETMKKIPEMSRQIDTRKKTVITFDENRITSALNSDRIEMKGGMSREEKRRFILSHVS